MDERLPEQHLHAAQQEERATWEGEFHSIIWLLILNGYLNATESAPGGDMGKY